MYTVEKNPRSSITYYIDEEKGVVTAVIFNPYKEIKSYLDKIYKMSDIQSVFDMFLYKREAMPTKLTGKAVCDPSDTFDIEKGKEIARNKVLKKLYKFETQYLVDINNRFEEVLEVIEDQILQTSHCFHLYDKKTKKVIK